MIMIYLLVVAVAVLVALFLIPWVDQKDRREHERRHRRLQKFVDGDREDRDVGARED
jgi:hypothetical protein